MDSRIREIEQWLDEAKNDLQDGGREAYLRKLYLLDAEIRAVIKENDPLPEIKQASAGRRAPRAFNLPVAVAGVAAFAVIGSAVVFGQGVLNGNLRSAGFTGRVADSSLDGDMTMASLNRFPQGEEQISLDELDGSDSAPQFEVFDRDRVLAALSSESFAADEAIAPLSMQLASGSPVQAGPQQSAGQPRRGPVGDIGSGLDPLPVRNASQNSGIEVHMAMSRQPQEATAIPVPPATVIPMDQPSLSSLSQIPDNRAQSEPVASPGRFNYFPGYGDSSGVDPSGSTSDVNGRSSEVQLSGSTSGTKTKDGQVEKKVEKTELKKLLEKKLSKESRDTKDS
ncbi:hypothetical protein KDL44_06645 [bacterium]|nr:hypothetical protein [bacterium]